MKQKIVFASLTLIAVLFLSGCASSEKSTSLPMQKEAVNVSQPLPVAPPTETQTPAVDKTIVDCSGASDPSCFISRMSGCLPAITKMTGSDSKTAIEITILGVENEKCHFQRKINNVLNMDCFFPKGTLNDKTLGQMFGTDNGLQKVVDDACSKPGW
jgi:PBP1b-binding outer membrane lipoprotein LpoB